MALLTASALRMCISLAESGQFKLRLMQSVRRHVTRFILIAVCGGLASCQPHSTATGGLPPLVVMDLSQPADPKPIRDPVVLTLPRNASTEFVLQAALGGGPKPVLYLPEFIDTARHAVSLSVFAYQVLPVATDLSTADYVRQTGEVGGVRQVPRVLLPLPVTDGQVDLSACRDPEHTADTARHAINRSVLIFVELRSGADVLPGSYTSQCDLLESPRGDRVGSVPVRIDVNNVDLGTPPKLTIAAPLDWKQLASLYPDQFEAITPRLLSRDDPQHAGVIELLSQLVSLAHENRVNVYVPRLQPIVKWPPGEKPKVDWTDYDSILRPWTSGTGFSDHQPAGYWPLPEPDSLASFDAGSRGQFWHLAAEHFAQLGWLDRSAVIVHRDTQADPTDADAAALSSEARSVLLADPLVRIVLPLQDDRTELASDARPAGIPARAAARLTTQSPGLIYASAQRDWPADVPEPRHWIDAGSAGTLAGSSVCDSEQDVRTLAALAYLRDASMVQCGNPLPPSDGPAQADQLVWFYPGKPFGTDRPLPTLQLKWLSQAVQDYACFSQSPHQDDVQKMCRLICRPVKLLPGQHAEPIFDLLAGTPDAHASAFARALSLQTQKLSSADGGPASDAVDPSTVRWFSRHQQPTVFPAAVRWSWPDLIDQADGATPGRWIDAAVGIDLYNPAEEMPSRNQLQWASVPAGWEVHPQPSDVQALAQFQVHRVITHARFNLDKISPESEGPLELKFIDGFNGQSVSCNLTLPVAVSERRQKHLSLDASLQDWDAADAIHSDQPLVRMLDRPSLQSQMPAPADTHSSIYSAWSDENFYLAFKLAGVTSTDLKAVHNFVDYQSGRAWGEDVCELLIQPIYADNVVGPTMHVVCKPAGEWVERKSRSASGAPTWEPFDAAGLRYCSGVDPSQKIWSAELAIPWQAIAAANRARPGLLRFNLIQHQHATNRSASWAGPLDESRDDSISGLIFLRELPTPPPTPARR